METLGQGSEYELLGKGLTLYFQSPPLLSHCAMNIL